MPEGPRGEKRPADAIGAAVKIMRIATGEEEEDIVSLDDGKNPAAKGLEAKGGKARTSKLTEEQRAKIARKAAAKRWAERE
ncbi:MAG: hypothetical protein KIT00_05795 [Rhodospirillales bacterium]|nr:hypothetical protein [Rhodospirillales bacterium]